MSYNYLFFSSDFARELIHLTCQLAAEKEQCEDEDCSDDTSDNDRKEHYEDDRKPVVNMLDFMRKKKAPYPLCAGDWISYQHQVRIVLSRTVLTSEKKLDRVQD